jgi:hypothetical protein
MARITRPAMIDMIELPFRRRIAAIVRLQLRGDAA